MSIMRVACLQVRFRPDFFFNKMQEVPVKERLWPRFKEPDLREVGLREVARQPGIIRGCFARKKYHFNSTGIGKEADSSHNPMDVA